MFKDFIHIFVLSCEKATYLIEKQLHSDLGVIYRFQLRVHLSICKLCCASEKKSALIHRILSSKTKKIESAKCYFKTMEIDKFKSELKKKIKS